MTGIPLIRSKWWGKSDTWLRWYDEAGVLLLTGQEQAATERQARASAEAKAARYLAKLKSLGIEIDE